MAVTSGYTQVDNNDIVTVKTTATAAITNSTKNKYQKQ